MTAHTLFRWDEAEEIDLDEVERQAAADRAKRARHNAELEAAAQEAQAANAGYDEALRKYRRAPDGLIQRRRSDLRLANARVLKAELRYAEVQRQGPADE